MEASSAWSRSEEQIWANVSREHQIVEVPTVLGEGGKI